MYLRKGHIFDELEDEYHFLFECPIYADLRKQYIGRCFVVRPSMCKVIELFEMDFINICIIKGFSAIYTDMKLKLYKHYRYQHSQ